ncbi:Uncharacterised protein [Escherichia coli]|uniref:Uncharacterized protein n=1 Tax=Escherichia coli TaxID=562 RepID=A0A376MVT2_ECOLX|nr:Uncharacterised protein [Escherichia coli]
MGLREEIQSEVAAAFDEDLADAVSDFFWFLRYAPALGSCDGNWRRIPPQSIPGEAC